MELFLRLGMDNPYDGDGLPEEYIAAVNNPLTPKSVYWKYHYLSSMELVGGSQNGSIRLPTLFFLDGVQFIKHLFELGLGNPSYDHDAGILTEHLESNGVHAGSGKHPSDLPPIDRSKMSFSKFPFTLIDHTSELLPPPENTHSLQDTEAMKQLTAADKEEIHRAQRAKKIPETDFSGVS